MYKIFHQLPMQVSQYCNGAFTITRIFKWEGKSFLLSVIGGSAPSVLPKGLWHLELAAKYLLRDIY